MNSKRLVGTGKIFLHSGGVVLIVAGIIWLIINGAFAVYLFSIRYGRYHDGTYDILTPWIIMAASMAVYYRYQKMCSANNVSGRMQIGIFSFLSLFCSAMFAAADLLFAEIVMQRPYSAVTRFKIEVGSPYLSKLINTFKDMFDSLPQNGSSSSSGIMLLTFIAVTLYYYCFWVTGSYFMCCFVCQKRKRLIYIGIMTMLVPVLLSNNNKIGPAIELGYNSEWIITALKSALALIILIGFLTDPVLIMFSVLGFLYRAIGYKSADPLVFNIFVFAVFASVMLIFTGLIDKVQSPGRRKIKSAIDNYHRNSSNKKKNKMNDRLKNTILCSLLMARKIIVILMLTEYAVFIISLNKLMLMDKFDFAIGADFLPLILVLLAGMSFFDRHNSFCMANAVSRRNRFISAGAVSAVICLLVSVTNRIIWAFISEWWISLGELVRTVSHVRMISGGNIPADIIEMVFFWGAVFSIGYFLGGFRYSKGGTVVMITLIISAVVMFGSVFLYGIINFTPAMVIMYIPVLMQKNAVMSVIFDIIIAAVLLWVSVRLSETAIERQGAKLK